MALVNSAQATLPVFDHEVARGFVLGAKACLPKSQRYIVMKMFLIYEWPPEEQDKASEELERAHDELSYSRKVIDPTDERSLAQGFILGSLVDRTVNKVPLAKVIEGSLQLVHFTDPVKAIEKACRELADCQVLSIDDRSRPVTEWRITSLLRSDRI